jgi:hypothetical protein
MPRQDNPIDDLAGGRNRLPRRFAHALQSRPAPRIEIPPSLAIGKSGTTEGQVPGLDF